MDHEEILAVLRAKKVGEKKWTCHCPNLAAHKNGDRRPSAVIYLNEYGLVYKCSACGADRKEIAKIIGIPLSNWYSSGAKSREFVDHLQYQNFVYRREDGKPVMRVSRGIQVKTFRIDVAVELPDGSILWAPRSQTGRFTRSSGFLVPDENGELCSVVKPDDLYQPTDYLYHCDIWTRPDRVRKPLFIVEGERKADLLERLGLNAACNPMGAGKFTSKHARFLAGRDVIILPDNDQPGIDHACKVCGLAVYFRCKSVLIMPTEVLYTQLNNQEKADVCDLHKSLGSDDKLLGFLRECYKGLQNQILRCQNESMENPAG